MNTDDAVAEIERLTVSGKGRRRDVDPVRASHSMILVDRVRVLGEFR